MLKVTIAAAAVVCLVGCGGSGTGTGGEGGSGGAAPCDPTKAACSQLQHDFGKQTVTSGQEVSSLCQSWTLNNPEELWVNQVELDNDGAYHHSNWFFVPNTVYPHDDGVYPCSEIMFDELVAAVAGGVLFAQSTQSTHEVQKFPPGAAIRVPPYVRVIGSTHLLNTTQESVDTSARMTITSIPAADAKVKLAPFRLTYYDLHIPAQASSVFQGSCDFASSAAMASEPFGLQLYYVLPHYHKLGTSFHLGHYGGPHDGEEIFSIDGFNGEARGRAFDPPVDMSADKGFTFSCGYTNPTTKEVGWGIGDQEMCEMLGFADSALVYDATVKMNMVEGMSGTTVNNTGPCEIIDLPWDPNAPGGTPPGK